MNSTPRRRSTDHQRRDFSLLIAAVLALAGWCLIAYGMGWLS